MEAARPLPAARPLLRRRRLRLRQGTAELAQHRALRRGHGRCWGRHLGYRRRSLRLPVPLHHGADRRRLLHLLHGWHAAPVGLGLCRVQLRLHGVLLHLLHSRHALPKGVGLCRAQLRLHRLMHRLMHCLLLRLAVASGQHAAATRGSQHACARPCCAFLRVCSGGRASLLGARSTLAACSGARRRLLGLLLRALLLLLGLLLGLLLRGCLL